MSDGRPVSGELMISMQQASQYELRRLMRLAPPREWGERTAADPANFLPADPARAYALRAGGEIEPAVVFAAHATRFLERWHPRGATVLLAAYERSHATLRVRLPDCDHARLARLADAVGRHVGGAGRATAERDRIGDAEIRVTRPTAARLQAPVGEGEALLPTFLPVAALPAGALLYANWEALDHVLVAGDPGAGVDIVMTGLIAELAARRSPADLRLWSIGHGATPPPGLFRLPHWQAGPVDPADLDRLADMVASLKQELADRERDAIYGAMGVAVPPRGPTHVVIIEELAALRDMDLALYNLGTGGPKHGIRLLAGTTRLGDVDVGLLRHFASRLVLRITNRDQSWQLLGSHAATKLHTPGQLLVAPQYDKPRHFAGIAPHRLRGLRIVPERLAALTVAICDRWPAPVPRAWPAIVHHVGVSNGVASDGLPPDDQARRASAADVPGGIAARALSGEPMPQILPRPDGDDPRPPETEGHPNRTSGDDDRAAPQRFLDEDAPSDHEARDPRVGTEQAPQPVQGQGSAVVEEKSPLVSPEAATERHVEIAATSAPPSPVEMVPPLLMVYCFGGLRIVARGGTVLTVNDQHIPVKLLALLAASRAGVVSKDDAFTALWPDQADAGLLERLHAACKNLRHLLQKLAPEVSRDVIRQEGNRIALDLSLVASDVPAFWALCARAEDRRRPLDEALALYDQLAALYRGELLAGCGYPWPDLRGEDGFTPREVCKARLTDLTRTLAERSLAEGRPALAKPLLRRLLADDPTRPELVKRLLDCEAGMGNLSELRRVRQSFERACREEFAADPDDPGEDAIMRELLADVRIHYDAILTRLRRLAGGD